MIVSASYRTDIPAFYADWFACRLEAGFCRVVNPYGGPDTTVPLAGPGVDGFVFWTRNAAPFRDALDAVVRHHRKPFVVQFTVLGYPRVLDRAVIVAERAVAQIRDLAAQYGPRAVVWRYDPIVIADPTPPEWHCANLARLAAALAGAVDEVVVSFAQMYRKTARNLGDAARQHGFAWRDPPVEQRRALLAELAPVAAAHGMALTLCTQPALEVPGTAPSRCVDAGRLSAVAAGLGLGSEPIAARTRGNRPGCLCAESRDIGAYDTCPHGCVYCYAVAGREAARRAWQSHDPAGEYLLPPARPRLPATAQPDLPGL